MKMAGPAFFIMFWVLVSVSATAGEMRVVQAAKMSVLAEPKMGSVVSAEVLRGREVEVLQTEGLWCQVSVDGKTGWTSRLFLSPHHPLSRVPLHEPLEKKQSDAEADFEALKKMETYGLDSEAVVRFRAAAKLN